MIKGWCLYYLGRPLAAAEVLGRQLAASAAAAVHGSATALAVRSRTPSRVRLSTPAI